MQFVIEHQCPQCGAPADLQETDRLVKCGYCRVNSYLSVSKFFRYTIPHNAPSGKDIIYYPYWRFKGMLFSCLKKGIEKRFMDVSLQALQSHHFPINIGFRGQTQKLQFATEQEGVSFIKPQLPFNEALAGWTRQYSARLKEPILHQDYIGETHSLIYAPYYLERKVIDGVLIKPVSTLSADQIEDGLLHSDTPRWPINFLATLCPQCGWDLTGDRDSLALNCTNCRTVWWPKKGRLAQLNTGHFTPSESSDQWVFLPFWRIQADIQPIALRSYADLVRVANLPKVVQPNWDRKPFYFWNPAFKVRPQSYLNIANNTTLNQPMGKFDPGQPKGNLHGVNLPLSEALESLKLIIANILKPIEQRAALVPKIEIKARRFLLVYLPFKDTHHELVQPELKLAINKNMLAHAKNL
jgi:DNA-directed RNA polymerase subunit RPC12/RpoP